MRVRVFVSVVSATLAISVVTACGGSPTQPMRPPDPPPVVITPPPAPAPSPSPAPTVPPPQTVPPPRVGVTRILAFGDSLTEGRIAVTANFLAVVPGSYPERLKSQLGARYSQQIFTVPNEGMGGEWALDGAQRFPGVIRTHAPEVVILLEGANDLAALGRSGMSTATRALETMAKEARFRGARVILAGLPPQRAPFASVSLVSEFNARIREVARGETAIYVDLAAAFAGGEATLIGPDGLHPTPAGYERMAQTFLEAIRANFELPAAPSTLTKSSHDETHPRITLIARILPIGPDHLNRTWLRRQLLDR